MKKSYGVNELRRMYLEFFESKGHLAMKSFSLVPHNDNSLLLINAGMAPLKPYFTGQEIPPRRRVTTCQKCIRTGDIENVGKTARHLTFFDMLGNFLYKVCHCKGDWTMRNYAEEAIKQIREKVGDGKVLLALSGGVDSSVACALLSKAVGNQLTCVFVDHGFMRKNEGDEVEAVFGPDGPYELNFIRVNAQQRYYDKLAGVTEPTLYGICVRMKKPLIATWIACIVNAIFCAIFSVRVYSFGAPSFFTMPIFLNPDGTMSNFYFAIAAAAITIVVSFVSTLVLGFDDSIYGEEAA